MAPASVTALCVADLALVPGVGLTSWACDEAAVVCIEQGFCMAAGWALVIKIPSPLVESTDMPANMPSSGLLVCRVLIDDSLSPSQGPGLRVVTIRPRRVEAFPSGFARHLDHSGGPVDIG